MSTSVQSTAASLRIFLKRILDYAGLFPPASLEMKSSVENYARYLRHPHGWLLGRFVLPVARLDEFLNSRQPDAPDNTASGPWHLSAIVSANIAADLATAAAFNRQPRGAVIDALEVRVFCPGEIEQVHTHRPPGTTIFFELAPQDCDELLPMVSRLGGCAKLRTGGVVPGAFPSVETVAGFLHRCAELGVPFKATAGLHHPLRGIYPLTYAAESPCANMHGFLNLFTAAAIAWSARQSGRSSPSSVLAACLAGPERANWHFAEDALTWSGDRQPVRMELDSLLDMRANFGLSFGSCSFEEPIAEIRELDLL